MTTNLESLFDVTPEGEEVETPVETVVETPAVAEETETTTPSPEEKHEETPAETSEETGTETPAAESTPTGDKTPDADEVLQLRALLREQNKRLRELEATSKKTSEELKEKGFIEEPSEEEAAAAQKEQSIRASLLETVLETMRINPKYEDVDSVVTQSRFDDMVEGYAYAVAKQQGGKAEDYIDAVAAKIWGMPNPYRYMYDNIKQYHPDFSTKETPKVEPATGVQKPAETREPKPHTSPTTISNLPASSEGGGWTAARIDGMAEEDLGKVPGDIYRKYLSGELK